MEHFVQNIKEEVVPNLSLREIDDLNQKAWNIRVSDLRTSWKLANDTERFSHINSYQKGIAESSRNLGYCLWRFGDYSQSLEKSMIALEIFRSLKDKKGEADTLNSVGAVYMYQGDNDNRLKCNQLCLQIRSEIDDKEGVASSEGNIGETHMEMGNFEEANKWFAKCLKNPHAPFKLNHGHTIILELFFTEPINYKKPLSLSNKVLSYQIL